MFRCSISIFFTILLLLELAAIQQTSVKVTETEKVFFDFRSDNGTKKNKPFRIIFPGTRWCGDGDIAEHNDDLGHFKETDACCRQHDLCSNIIYSGESKYGLSNGGHFSRVECSCDEEFYNCLSSLCSPLALSIGITYFDILRPQCFTLDYPYYDCIQEESDSTSWETCNSCKIDKTKPKKWQWRETKNFANSETSKKLFTCFEDVTAEKLKITQEKISNFIQENGVEPLIKMCSNLPFDSWYKKFLCPKILPFFV
ncbi:phospholipase A2-like [Leptopilina heterotoma]|uniref:phospholipase A2-like n=1 Tax=Leptopilina heterotoma TaxID=63436 RepID=UPI001CA84230|nr:phospholipase A2-like [Leptopilina heterotoma]